MCGGFDAATVSDFTAIKLETVDGVLFTPRYGPDRRPAIWNPAEWMGRTPRGEVESAWAEIRDTYVLERVYCDPWHFQSEIAEWDRLSGGEVFLEWDTSRVKPMHEALELMVTDVGTRRLRHDGCPITTQHVGNARMLARNGKYILGKPSQVQKIDAAMASALAHKAAADARASGWGQVETTDTRVFCFR